MSPQAAQIVQIQSVRRKRRRRRRPVEITDEFAASIQFGAGSISDRALPGFYLRVGKRVKRYEARAQHRNADSKLVSYRVILGRVGVVTAEAARKQARQVLQSIRATGRAHASNEPAVKTFAWAWERFREWLVRAGRSEATIKLYEDWFRRHLKPMHDKPVDAIVRDDAFKLLDDITRGKIQSDDAKGRHKLGGKSVANSVVKLANTIWLYAESELEVPGLPRKSPFRSKGLLHQEASRAIPGMGLQDVPGWRDHLQNVPSPLRRAMHVFFLLSGMREGSVLSMRWADIDLRARTLRIPNPKGGPSREYTLPLSQPMVLCSRCRRSLGYGQPKARAATCAMLATGGSLIPAMRCGAPTSRSHPRSARRTT